MELLTLIAILVGPILAVFATRFVDGRRQRDERRNNIFKTLMKTRRNRISSEHVEALNLIELEFADDKVVIDEWKKLFTHFGNPHSRRQDEIAAETLSDQDKMLRDTMFYNRLADERQRQLAKLLHAMAKTLGFKAEQLDIFEGGYTPQGWSELEVEQHAARRFILDLAFGRKLLPVGIFHVVKDANEAVSHSGKCTDAE